MNSTPTVPAADDLSDNTAICHAEWRVVVRKAG